MNVCFITLDVIVNTFGVNINNNSDVENIKN